MTAASAARLARVAQLRARHAQAAARRLARCASDLASAEALEARLASLSASDGPGHSPGADQNAGPAPTMAWMLDQAMAGRVRLRALAATLAERRLEMERQWADAQAATLLARAQARAAAALASSRATAAAIAAEHRASQAAPKLARPLLSVSRAAQPAQRQEQ